MDRAYQIILRQSSLAPAAQNAYQDDLRLMHRLLLSNLFRLSAVMQLHQVWILVHLKAEVITDIGTIYDAIVINIVMMLMRFSPEFWIGCSMKKRRNQNENQNENRKSKEVIQGSWARLIV